MANVRNAAEDHVCTTSVITRRTFGSLLRHTVPGGCPLQIPLLQRRYCWEDVQLRRLVEDIGTDCGGDWGHGFGRIVVRMIENGSPLIIDGQQRLTTVVLLVAALRDVVRRRLQNLQAEDRQGLPAAEKFVGDCNEWLFPWVSKNTPLPALAELVSAAPEPKGQAVASAALIPTFLDRDSFWQAVHPDASLNSQQDLCDMSWWKRAWHRVQNLQACRACQSDQDAEAGAENRAGFGFNLEGPDRVRAAKATFVNFLEGNFLPTSVSKLGLAPVTAGARCSECSLTHVVQAAAAVLTSAMERCFVLFFAVREADVWSIYERLAFREASLQFMENRTPGISMAECDLVRNLLLSYFSTEEAQLSAYFSLWRPMEQAAEAVASRSLPRDKDCTVVRLMGRLMEQYLATKGPTSKQQALDCSGGAMHLSGGRNFPTYVKFRQMVEADLQTDSDPSVGEAAARQVLGELLSLSKDSRSFQEVKRSMDAPSLRVPRRPRGGMAVIADQVLEE